MKTEAKVGLFITLSLVFLFGLLSQLSSFDNFFKKSYPVMAKIDDGLGLKNRAKVKFKGVNIGYVESVTLQGNDVISNLLIDEGVKIPSDSIISVSQDSLLGGKFLDIKPGISTEILTPNMILSKETKQSSIADASTAADEAFQEIKFLVKEIRVMLSEGGKDDIQSSLANIREFTILLSSISKEDNRTIHEIITGFKTTLLNVDATVLKFGAMSDDITKTSQGFLTMSEDISKTAKDYSAISADISRTTRDFSQTAKDYSLLANNFNKDLPAIMAEIKSITEYLNRIGATLDKKLPPAMDKFVELEDNLNNTIVQKDSSLNKALTSVDGFFTEGTETMEKIDKYLDNMVKSELHVEMRSDEVYDAGGYSKSKINVALKPDQTRYYMIGLTSGPDFSYDESYEKGYEGNKVHQSGQYLLSAQYGKRFDDMLFRVGLIEGQGGFGFDYYAKNDRLKFSSNLYDFNAINDVRGDNPNLTATVRYQFFKHINAYVSGNNILNKSANSISFGVGVSFVDNDLKSLLGSAASAAN
jgi:phospholipid/cholesterol/gamma-HCH transport system substrate-binding protein